MGYTWAQFRTYLRLAEQRSHRRRAELLVDTSAAVNGGKGAQALLKALQQAAKG